MAYRGGRTRTLQFLSSGWFPPATKWLLIVNTAIFIFTFLFHRSPLVQEVSGLMALTPRAAVEMFMVWQLATYMFLHGGFSHIIWNMLALWMFGADLERSWGAARFLRYYMVCGIGAGICVVVANYAAGTPDVATIGSSGAIFGILLAYALLFPTRTILWGFLIPIQAKYFVMIVGAVAFLMSMSGGNTGISEFAHLGGLLVGYLYLKMPRVRLNPRRRLQSVYAEWKRQRMRRKFQVYLKKHDSDRDPWVQ